jgi:hypothetical protein
MKVDPADVLASNLSALSPRNPVLAQAIRDCAPDRRFRAARARTGKLVPVVGRGDGDVPLHSLYDPMIEARRVVGALPEFGCIVAFGLGAGYHAFALLENPHVSLVFIIEKDVSTLRSLFQSFPLETLLRDPRVTLTAGTEGIHTQLPSAWLPALMGNLRTLPLRSWCDTEPAFFVKAAAEVQRGIEALRADYGVQAHFGKRWLTNIIHNLAGARDVNLRIPPVGSACITAAGPSLDESFSRVAEEKGVSFIIATDTSLPALLRAGIEPDAVLSIDCQSHSYHHFMQGVPENTLVFLDAASPSCLARRFPHAAFVGSNHPLMSYFAGRGLRLPRVDMSGGNVTHAAVSLARSLGAARIALFGADFSYPDGKAYARGTYLYDFFGCRQGRLAPLEALFASFLLRSPDTARQPGSRPLYTTPVLTAYRDRLATMIATMDADVMSAPGRGVPLPAARREVAGPAAYSSLPRRDPAWEQAGKWPEMNGLLAAYVQGLQDLSDIPALPGPWFYSLPPGQVELVYTLLPVAACIQREMGSAEGGRGALEAARQWTLQRINRQLASRSFSAQE